jgi:glycosyltransferase involved in cell wall biosynthesis
VRLAWFSPLPPVPSGISDYSAEILPFLAARADVTAFSERPRGLFRRLHRPPGVPVAKPDAYRPGDFDAAYFHLGNNPWHEFVYEAFLANPGIAVFHDFVTHHLVAHLMVEAGHQEDRYLDILEAEHGDVGTKLFRLKRYGVATDFEKFLFPLAGYVAKRAAGIVVHSPDSAEKMAELAPGVPLEVIPHHAGAPPAAVAGVSREEARRRLKLPAKGFVVGHFGFITRPKQPDAVVLGFERLHAEDPDALLVLVGADHTGGGLDRMLDRHGLRGAVRHAGFVDLERFYLYLRAVDAVINLRYPSAGESSGTFARALAEGKPTIVNNYGSFAEVPRDVTLKVEIDGPQGEQVGEHLLRLHREPEFREALAERARGYARAVLDPDRCRDLYVDFAGRVGRAAGVPA